MIQPPDWRAMYLAGLGALVLGLAAIAVAGGFQTSEVKLLSEQKYTYSNGQRIDLGPGPTDYFYSDGSPLPDGRMRVCFGGNKQCVDPLPDGGWKATGFPCP